MMRTIQWINFAGVLAVAGLCGSQWRTNRTLHLQVNDLEKARFGLLDQLAERDHSIQGLTADLEEFRARLTLAESQMKELEAKLSLVLRERNKLSLERDQLVAERNQLKVAVEQWTAAVHERDAAIKSAAAQAAKLISDRNDAVVRFNDLVAKYNILVKDYDTVRAAATRPAR